MIKTQAVRELENEVLKLTARVECLEFTIDKQEQEIESLSARVQMLLGLEDKVNKLDEAMLVKEVAEEEEKEKSKTEKWLAGVR